MEMDLKTAPQSDTAVLITPATLNTMILNKKTLFHSTFWHKFIIDDVHSLKREQMLKILIEYAKPFDFIPLCYTINNTKGAYFFARFCGPVIEKLFKDKLTVTNPYQDTQIFQLTVILKYATTNEVKVNCSRNVLKVLRERHNKSTLNLNKFSEDPNLNDCFLLSQPKLLAFVLNIASNLKFSTLQLCGNEIQTLDALNMLKPKGISAVDFRNNLINDLAELKYLEGFNITELWIEGNPLCDIYDEYSYVQEIIKYCPKIEKIDGFLLRQDGVPSFRRNFLCHIRAHDEIDMFLHRFFTNYDTKNFAKLELLYTEQALFSMTFNSNQLTPYKTYSRNLLQDSTSCNLFRGRSKIINLYKIFSYVEHDIYSFTVDVLHYSGKQAIIVVTGLFREILKIENILGFNRFFVLECNNGVYSICNEQLHVFNALESQKDMAFRKYNLLEGKNTLQQGQLINTFTIITTLTKDWSKRFLEECHYNLKHAMVLFMDLYKGDKIPQHCFRET